jgi:ERCC4-type nuclease
MIYVDSREKQFQKESNVKIRNVSKYFEQNNIEYEVKKLEIGDYVNPQKQKFVIDKKKDLNEVQINLCSKDKSRFWREVRSAYKQGIKLVILVEQSGITELSDVVNWKSKYSCLDGKRLLEEMFRVATAYGIEWKFCDKRNTGKTICELLGVKKIDGYRRN